MHAQQANPKDCKLNRPPPKSTFAPGVGVEEEQMASKKNFFPRIFLMIDKVIDILISVQQAIQAWEPRPSRDVAIEKLGLKVRKDEKTELPKVKATLPENWKSQEWLKRQDKAYHQ